jgi:hypothetical protein
MCEYSITAHSDGGSMQADNPLKVYIDPLRSLLVEMGRPPPELKFMKTLLEKAEFEDIKAKKVKQPLGPWPKDPRVKRV